MARPHGHPLPLPAGQGLRLAVQELVVQIEQAGGLAHPPGPLLLGHALHLQREAHVLRDALARVQGVVLEHHRDVPVLGRHEGDVLLADLDAPAVQRLQPGQHAQRGGLPGSGRADQDHELAILDVQVEGLHRGRRVLGVHAARRHELHTCHRGPPPWLLPELSVFI
jgi:hypothetical protein